MPITGEKQAMDPPECNWWRNFIRGVPVQGHTTLKLKCVDLFCGVGGLSLGAAIAAESCGVQLDHSLAIDIDEEALKIYRRNFGSQRAIPVNLGSILDYHIYGRGASAQFAYAPLILNTELRSYVGNVDLLLAGPPCQGHSSLNNRTRRKDPRNQFYVCAIIAGIALEARMIVIENVPDVERDHTEVVATARSLLRTAGYCVSQGVLSASELGGAQSRRRHFTIATMKPHYGLEYSALELSKTPLTLRDAIGDLLHQTPKDFMDEVPVLSEENVRRIDYLFEHDLYELPDEIRPASHRDGHTYPSVYGRLHWDLPSPTITTGFMTPGRGRYIHPSLRRVISPREAARIQGFPDWFKFSVSDEMPSRRSLAKWIGDAVPTPLGYAAVLTALSGS